MSFTEPQQKLLAVTPKVSGSLSVISSLFIIRSVLTDAKERTDGTYYRLLVGLSCMDVIASFTQALSTLPMPQDTPAVWGAAGSTETCTAQGFFEHMIVAVPIYNASITINTLLRARFSWSEGRLRKIERLMHVVPLVLGVVLAFPGLPLKLYNHDTLWCSIAPFPLGCADSHTRDQVGACTRGANAWQYKLILTYAWVWISIFTSTICMIAVYLKVLEQERAVDQYQENGVVIRTRSNKVALQSFWYVLAFYAVWVPPSVAQLLHVLPGVHLEETFPLAMFMAVFGPAHGTLNFIIFFRARYHTYVRQHPKTGRWDALKKVMVSSLGAARTSDDNALESHSAEIDRIEEKTWADVTKDRS